MLVARLGEEMASFRRRAHGAESRVRELEEELRRAREEVAAAFAAAALAPSAPERAAGPFDEVATSPPLSDDERDRLATLQRENEELRARLEGATSRTTQMLERLRFLRQQHTLGGQR